MKLINVTASSTCNTLSSICIEPTLKPRSAWIQMPPFSHLSPAPSVDNTCIKSHVSNIHWPQQPAVSITTLILQVCNAPLLRREYTVTPTKGYVTSPVLIDPTSGGEEQKKPDTWKWACDLTQSAKQEPRSQAVLMLCFDSYGCGGFPDLWASPVPAPPPPSSSGRQPSLSQTPASCTGLCSSRPLSPGVRLSLGGGGLQRGGSWASESRI